MRPLTEVSFCTSPFDLHVLGTPPAFVLSQDQTLKKIVLTLASLQVPISLSLIAHSILTYHYFLKLLSKSGLLSHLFALKKISRVFSYLLFNFQGSFRAREDSLSRVLAYSTTSHFICQALLSSFFKLF